MVAEAEPLQAVADFFGAARCAMAAEAKPLLIWSALLKS